jgi:hypothetical protein
MLRQDHRLELVLPRVVNERPELTWDWLAQADALYLQRPALPEHLVCARQARTMGLKVWIDWDDDIIAVRRSNPGYAMYARPEVQVAVRELGQVAHVISVSTAELGRAVTRQGIDQAKVTVVPNACPWGFSDKPRQQIVTWRGTRHHFESLAMALPAIREIANDPEFTQWEWHFLGEIPWEMYEAIPGDRLKHHQGRGIYQYMELFSQLAPLVHIVPLAPNDFNRAKSDLAWLEASAAGAITIAPDWEEWQRPGVVRYGDMRDFADKIRELLKSNRADASKFSPRVIESRQYIEQQRRPDFVNRQRWDVLNNLIAG